MKDLKKRLARLIALRDRASTPGEAAAAAAAIQKLLTRHQLTEDDVATEEVSHHLVAARTDKPWARWEMALLCEISKANQCQAFVVGDDERYLCVIGRKTNADAVEYLFKYTRAEVHRLAEEHVHSISRIQWDTSTRPPFGRFIGALRFGGDFESFALGCAAGISEAITKTANDETRRLQEAPPDAHSKALALVDTSAQENMDFYEEKFGKVTYREMNEGMDKIDPLSFQEGRRAGKGMIQERKGIRENHD